MMTNLFSIFDPATPSFMSINWIYMSGFVLLIFYPKWVVKSNYIFLSFKMLNYLGKEFMPLFNMYPQLILMSVSMFFYIVYNNVLGLAPYIFTSSSHLVFSLGLALSLWLSYFFFAWINNTYNSLAHLIPSGSPLLLMPFMVLVELISNLIRPITLSVRLAGNMVAGHLLMSLLSGSHLVFKGPVSIIILISQVLLSSLEVAVAFIQAYVFSVLISLYSAEALS